MVHIYLYRCTVSTSAPVCRCAGVRCHVCRCAVPCVQVCGPLWTGVRCPVCAGVSPLCAGLRAWLYLRGAAISVSLLPPIEDTIHQLSPDNVLT